jgi:ribosomal-protein-alanine N-acetyltransferase
MRWSDLFRRAAPVVEPADSRDAPAFARLHAGAFARGWSEQEFERLLIERNALAHRVRLGKKVIGFIVSRCAGDEAEVLSVAVTVAQQGRGYAGRLLMLHLGELAALRVRSVFLEVEENNQAARRLYERAGFREVGRREGYYRNATDRSGPRAAAIVMRRDLV